MKILLLFSSHSYSIYKIFDSALLKLGHEVKLVDPNSELNYRQSVTQKLKKYTPKKISERIEYNFFKDKNKHILEAFKEFDPEIVISYNDSFLLPATVKEMKASSKFIIFLADNPFYSFYKKYFLQITLLADLVITPDTGCKNQLIQLGVSNIVFSLIGIDGETFKLIKPTEKELNEFGHDLFYLGSIHNLESWAWKRALLLNEFLDYDVAFFGSTTWNKVLSSFPLLARKFTILESPMSFEELNLRMNCSKIYPVDAHPGILNGIHARVFDAIAAGILPVVEYKEDLNLIFKKVSPPTFRSFSEAKKQVDYFLKNENHRIQLSLELNNYLRENLSSEKCITNILEYIL